MWQIKWFVIGQVKMPVALHRCILVAYIVGIFGKINVVKAIEA